jgi:transposase
MFGWMLDIVKRTETYRFVVLPKRWIVERIVDWLANSRRLSKDYEILASSSETYVLIAMSHLMVRRLAEV